MFVGTLRWTALAILACAVGIGCESFDCHDGCYEQICEYPPPSTASK